MLSKQPHIFSFSKDYSVINNTIDLAEKFSLIYSEFNDWSEIKEDGYYLEVKSGPSILHNLSDGKRISVDADFFSGELQHRIKTFSKKQSLAKAVFYNQKKSAPLQVIDATGGFGRDAACLAALGTNILIYEKNPAVFCLLSSSLAAAKKNAVYTDIFKGELSCSFADAQTIFKNKNCNADVIYLDPMYPERKKKALSRKGMQVLQNMLGADNDREDLLIAAFESETAQVVVKRPPDIKPFFENRVNKSFNNKLACFDVYCL